MIPKISPDKYFRLENGVIIKGIEELPTVLEYHEKLFYNHVNDHKNDFARWIYEVYNFHDLSERLKHVKSKEETVRLIRAYLKNHDDRPTNQPIYQKTGNVTLVNSAESNKNPSFVWKNKKPVTNNPNSTPSTNKEAMPLQQKKDISNPIIQTTRFYQQKHEEKPVPKKDIVEIKQPVQTNKSEENTSDADKYFEKNPVIMSQFVKARQGEKTFKPLDITRYTGNEPPDKLLSLFKDTYSKSYERLIELRKAGFDTELVQIMLFRIPAKIKIYESSKDDKDSIVVKRYLNEIIEELNSIR